MTEAAFRVIAERSIRHGAPLYGVYFIDHQDGALYCVTRWLNQPSIACDQYWTRDNPDYWREKMRALIREDTRHWPRSQERPEEMKS